MKPKITIAIPAYNSAKTIHEAIASCSMQEYPHKEILVIDDGSKDDTIEIVKKIPNVRLIQNPVNLGIGKNLAKLMDEAQGKYIVYLCADDIFANKKVVGDIVNQFDNGDPAIGVIGRFFYFFMDGYEGAIGVCRDKNILTSSCCPSGMAFRKMPIEGSNKIFVEMPLIVAQYLRQWRWTMFEYDTIAARFHPGGNTGTKTSYYKESPLQNWIDLVGPDFKFHEGFIQIKNRAPHLLWHEIKLAVKTNKQILKDKDFWVYAGMAVLIPGSILRPFTKFYRHRITRRHVKIIERPTFGPIKEDIGNIGVNQWKNGVKKGIF